MLMKTTQSYLYVDKESDNTLFYIKSVDTIKEGEALLLLSKEHPIFSESEKQAALEALQNYKSHLDEDPEFYLSLNFNLHSSFDCNVANKAIEEFNKTRVSEIVCPPKYYRCLLSIDKAPQISKVTDAEYVEDNIKYGRFGLVTSTDDLSSKEKIINVINEYKTSNSNSYVVSYCVTCQRYSLFVLPKPGKCDQCGGVLNKEMQDNTDYHFFKSSDKAQATQKYKEYNEELISKRNTAIESNNVIYRYNGTPYTPVERSKLLYLLYKNKGKDRSGNSVLFERDENNYLVFKKEFSDYADSLNHRFFQKASMELENIQSSGHIDEDVALYWFFHEYKYARDTLNEYEGNRMITKLGDIYSPKEFVNKFLKGSLKEQLYLMSLLNDVYLEYFFAQEDDLFSDADTDVKKQLAFSKYIYKTTGKYVYISDKDVVIFKDTFVKDFVKHDDLTDERFRFISGFAKDNLEFYFGKGKSLHYASKSKDGYDFNCYFATVYFGNENYVYEDLVIPWKNMEEIRRMFKQTIDKAYFEKDDDGLYFLKEIYNRGYLDAIEFLSMKDALEPLNRLIKKDIDLLDLYLELHKGETIDTIKINKIGLDLADEPLTLFELALLALKNNKLSNFAKDKIVSRIIKATIANSEEIQNKASLDFDKIVQKVKAFKI